VALSVILVIDPNAIFRTGLRIIIEEQIKDARVILASAIEDVAEFERVDLILVDAGSLTPDCLKALKDMHARHPQTRSAVISSSNARTDVLACLSAGFHGFVPKWQSDDEMVAAIKDLLAGRVHVPDWLAQVDKIKAEKRTRPRLTRRQKEILPLLAQGMSNKAIARRMQIAEGTTKVHVAALLRALGAHNRTEAAFKAADMDFGIEPESRLSGPDHDRDAQEPPLRSAISRKSR
jgi:DNA-binding NarL/FixJ family response regulator